MYRNQTYRNETMDTFEIFGGYIIDRFYNHIYEKAQEMHAMGKAPSLTKAYGSVCRMYLLHFKKEQLFKQTLKALYEYFNRYSRVPLLTHTEWADLITKEFTPTDYWPSLSSVQKDHLLGILIEGIYNKFSVVMLSPRGQQMVIDDHENRDNIQFLQDKMLNIMINQREEIYARFIKPINAPKSDALVQKLRDDLLKETKKSGLLKDALVKSNNEVKEQAKEIQSLISAKEYLIEKARNMNIQIQDLLRRIDMTKPVQPAQVPVHDTPEFSTPEPVTYQDPAMSPKISKLFNEFDMFEDVEPLEVVGIAEVVPDSEPAPTSTVDTFEDDDMENTRARILAKQKERIAKRESSKVEIETDNLEF